MTFLNRMDVAVTVTCAPELAGVIPNTLLFEVSSSAFFKTGRPPNPRYAACLIDYEWTHEMDGRAGSADSREARSLTTHD